MSEQRPPGRSGPGPGEEGERPAALPEPGGPLPTADEPAGKPAHEAADGPAEREPGPVEESDRPPALPGRSAGAGRDPSPSGSWPVVPPPAEPRGPSTGHATVQARRDSAAGGASRRRSPLDPLTEDTRPWRRPSVEDLIRDLPPRAPADEAPSSPVGPPPPAPSSTPPSVAGPASEPPGVPPSAGSPTPARSRSRRAAAAAPRSAELPPSSAPPSLPSPPSGEPPPPSLPREVASPERSSSVPTPGLSPVEPPPSPAEAPRPLGWRAQLQPLAPLGVERPVGEDTAEPRSDWNEAAADRWDDELPPPAETAETAGPQADPRPPVPGATPEHGPAGRSAERGVPRLPWRTSAGRREAPAQGDQQAAGRAGGTVGALWGEDAGGAAAPPEGAPVERRVPVARSLSVEVPEAIPGEAAPSADSPVVALEAAGPPAVPGSATMPADARPVDDSEPAPTPAAGPGAPTDAAPGARVGRGRDAKRSRARVPAVEPPPVADLAEHGAPADTMGERVAGSARTRRPDGALWGDATPATGAPAPAGDALPAPLPTRPLLGGLLAGLRGLGRGTRPVQPQAPPVDAGAALSRGTGEREPGAPGTGEREPGERETPERSEVVPDAGERVAAPPEPSESLDAEHEKPQDSGREPRPETAALPWFVAEPSAREADRESVAATPKGEPAARALDQVLWPDVTAPGPSVPGPTVPGPTVPATGLGRTEAPVAASASATPQGMEATQVAPAPASAADVVAATQAAPEPPATAGQRPARRFGGFAWPRLRRGPREGVGSPDATVAHDATAPAAPPPRRPAVPHVPGARPIGLRAAAPLQGRRAPDGRPPSPRPVPFPGRPRPVPEPEPGPAPMVDVARLAAAGSQRELILVVAILVIASRLAAGPFLWIAAALALGAASFGALEVLGAETDPADPGVPIESLILPGASAVAAIGALQLVPVGLLLIPAFAGSAALTWGCLTIERRVLLRPDGPSPDDRAGLLSLLLLIAFMGFTGIAAAIPGAFVDPGATTGVGSGGGTAPLSLVSLAVLAAGDAAFAGLLGYRLAALRAPTFPQAVGAALSYAVIIAIAAAALRAMAIPRLVGPALLVLVLYLWGAYRAAPRGDSRDRRWVVEMVLLASLGAFVVVLNLMVKG